LLPTHAINSSTVAAAPPHLITDLILRRFFMPKS
jgi:hypothetical protein